MKRELLLAAVVLFLLPNVTFGQTAPDLGATSSFALFTAGGAFDSNGATKVTGNIGSFTVTPTIAGPGIVTGTIYNVGDPALNLPFADVSTAYSDLTQAGTVIGVTVLDGLVLTPGVYTVGAASSLSANGVLTLNGQGDPNALFIIRINGAFTTGTYSTINLINSASPNNVYWQISGAFTLGDYSVFRGNIVSGGAIELLDGSSLIGRGLTTAGAIHLHNNVITLGTPPAAPTVTLTQPTCSVGTGTITITAPTGTGMTYSIDGLTYTNTTGVFSSLTPGTYNVTAKNSDGYVSLRTTVTINAQPSPPANATASTTIQPTCSLPTGTIVVTAPLGAGYEYNIDGGVYQLSVTFAGVAAGSHNILVRRTTDNTCISGATAVTVNAASTPANATASTTIQPTCSLPTGTIVVTAPLGVGYEYNIDGGTYQASVTFAGIAAGLHNILVRSTTDNSCISGATAVTVNAQPPTPNVVNQTISILTGGTFSVTPSGVPAGTTYTWIVPTYTGGVTGGIAETGQTDIHGTLTIPSGNGTATYTVTPTSGLCAGATFTVIVTVTDACVPVTIGTQPIDNSICGSSGNTTFTVVASGTAPFTYQWQYNNGGTWANVANGTPTGASYTNATTATLNVAGITISGSYQYRCYITNCSGSNNATSNAVTLTVNPVPATSLIYHNL